MGVQSPADPGEIRAANAQPLLSSAAHVYCVISGGDEADGVMASLARREDRWLHDIEKCNSMTIDFF